MRLFTSVQDSWVIHEGLGGSSNVVMAVFDGHGQEGEKVSQYLSTTLPTMLANSPNFKASHPLVPA